MKEKTVVQIVTEIVEDARADTNEELELEFEYSAFEYGYSEAEVEEALASEHFPWFRD